jgi:hypothetical protein
MNYFKSDLSKRDTIKITWLLFLGISYNKTDAPDRKNLRGLP